MGFKKNIIAFIIISVLGTLGHFVFKWTDKNYIAGLFFPVNESVWEHLKLLFFPSAIYSATEYLLKDKKPSNYLQAVVFSAISGMFWIVALFYTVKGVVGYNIDFINIMIYYVGVIISLYKKNRIIFIVFQFWRNNNYVSSGIGRISSSFKSDAYLVGKFNYRLSSGAGIRRGPK